MDPVEARKVNLHQIGIRVFSCMGKSKIALLVVKITYPGELNQEIRYMLSYASYIGQE